MNNPEMGMSSGSTLFDLSGLEPGRLVTIDIIQDDPKQYEVLSAADSHVLLKDPDTNDRYLVPTNMISIVDTQTPHNQTELDKYSLDAKKRAKALANRRERIKRHKDNKETDDDKGADDRGNVRPAADSTIDRLRAKLSPTVSYQTQDILSPRLRHIFHKYDNFLAANQGVDYDQR